MNNKRSFGMVLAIIGLAVLAGLSSGPLQSLLRPLTKQQALENELRHLATWKPVEPAKNDPIVATTRGFIEHYNAWFSEKPLPPTSLNPDLKNFVTVLHRWYARECTKQGVAMSPPNDVWSLNDTQYDQLMAPATTYLRQRGWSAGFTRPRIKLDKEKKPRISAEIYLGKVRFRSDGTLNDSDNKKAKYIIDLIESEGMISSEPFTVTAMTENGYSAHFLRSHEQNFGWVNRVCAGNPENGHDSTWLLIQWKDDYRQLGGDSPGFYARVMTDTIGYAIFRELQHMKDHRLIAKIRSMNLGPKKREAADAYIESRGLMAAMSQSDVPLYGMEEITEWSGDSDPGRSTGATLASVYIGHVGATTRRPLDEQIEALAIRANSGLNQTNSLYRTVYERLGKANDVFNTPLEQGLLREGAL